MNLTCGLWVGALGRGWKRLFVVALATLAACSGMPADPDAGADMAVAAGDMPARDVASITDAATDGPPDPMDAAIDAAPPAPDLTGDLALPASCKNQVQDGDESDVDCGGSCAPCPPGRMCKRSADCESRACGNGKCLAPACDDTVKNGNESDVDCGGPSCPKCVDGKACQGGTDCASGDCFNNVCRPAPACNDAKKNGDETDVDCGGAKCPKCADGKMCQGAMDCASANCLNNLCKPAPTCMDMAKNGNETDVDCGGGTCPRCADAKACTKNEDCASNLCMNNACQPPPMTCKNGFKDGQETDLDCGGMVCPPCAIGKKCLADRDCTTAYCHPMTKVCTQPSCGDQVKNNTETDVDCGGPDMKCKRCGEGKACLADSDCAAIPCKNNKCTETTRPVSFGPAKPFAWVDKNTSLLSGDFNGDKKNDLVIETNGASGPILYLGDGAGNFTKKGSPPSPTTDNRYMAVFDANGDGKLDLARTDTFIRTWLGNGDGTFMPSVLHDPGVHSGAANFLGVTTADLNGDGKGDLVQVYSDTQNKLLTGRVLVGNGDGTFKASLIATSQGSYGRCFTADMNGDKKIDVVLFAPGNNALPSVVDVYLGVGDGTVKPAIVTQFMTGYINGLIGEVNGDGKPDLVAKSGQTLAILLGRGDGGFQMVATQDFANQGGLGQKSPALLHDVNGDGMADYLVATVRSLTVHRSAGDGTFLRALSFDMGLVADDGSDLAALDANGDGKPDVAFMTSGASPMAKQAGVLLNTSQ